MASSASRARADPTPLTPSRPTQRRHLHIEDYRFGRWRSLTRAAEVRRQRAYFPRGSAPFGHFTHRLRHEQMRMLKLRELCRLVRDEAELAQALRQRSR
jgi:hypothetical protein